MKQFPLGKEILLLLRKHSGGCYQILAVDQTSYIFVPEEKKKRRQRKIKILELLGLKGYRWKCGNRNVYAKGN